MFRYLAVLVLLAATLQPERLEAQFSSDIPGVPRASIPFRGGHQNRTEWTFAGYRIPTLAEAGDTTAFGLRLSYGRSYRVATTFEIGFDITITDGLFQRPPQDSIALGGTSGSNYMRASGLYGLRLGGKWRPISALDPDGYGWEVAVGGAIQPALKPLIGAERYADSTRIGGQFHKQDDDAQPERGLNGADPFGTLHTASFVTGMASYRSKRVLVDVALVAEAVSGDDESDAVASPLVKFDGLSPRAGAMYRLRRSLAVGVSYWGKGAPPWRDQISVGVPGAVKEEHYGFILTTGARPESGVDLMVSTPNGDWGQSVRLSIRARSTR
jgi:hypothetical protein